MLEKETEKRKILQHFMPHTKIAMAIRLSAYKAKDEGKPYHGTTIAELENILEKLKESNFDFGISSDKLPEILKSAEESGRIFPTLKFDAENRAIRAYVVDPVVSHLYDEMLEEVGLLETKIKVKI
ncbi:MAG: hypothetical protein OH319_02065 [Candidatus Parvarchaeota archaeon]|nr:hypothetical protein [Candidatus Jingweiarchaeum tengchongense]MCW1298154.1 hypothetical protein [Candidatus Jingweiarchaeum tengchongense]MCW1299953.1 hypothetical protein [Candidatus Jingweiarchaeum tengchongense]MCW1305062.1 hypothetical protein [Candidatus Jingweiarchaeum tengchongense]MCW1305575.1 hypothetical protein [Candidatus Jingweiarchaeum tengchongense]